MNIELINEPNKNYLALEQILINRGLSESQIYDYLNLSSDVVSSPIMLNEEDLKQGLTVFFIEKNNIWEIHLKQLETAKIHLQIQICLHPTNSEK